MGSLLQSSPAGSLDIAAETSPLSPGQTLAAGLRRFAAAVKVRNPRTGLFQLGSDGSFKFAPPPENDSRYPADEEVEFDETDEEIEDADGAPSSAADVPTSQLPRPRVRLTAFERRRRFEESWAVLRRESTLGAFVRLNSMLPSNPTCSLCRVALPAIAICCSNCAGLGSSSEPRNFLPWAWSCVA